MASAFDTETPVVLLDRTQTRGRHQPILYPAFGFRVAAPPTRERALNHFQKAVLGFCRIGRSGASEIARWLAIDPALARFLLDEVRSLGLVTTKGDLTRRGLDALAGEAFEYDALAVGWVFVDPWSQRVLPRFVTRLSLGDARWDGHRAYLVKGSKGSPDETRVHVLRYEGGSAPAVPKAEEILEAAYRHRRAQRAIEEAGEAPDDQDVFEARVMPMDRVAVLDQTPVPHFLATEVVVDLEAMAGWRVRDPFGTHEAPWLARLLAPQLTNDAYLRERIVELQRRSLEAAKDPAAWQALYEEEAQRTLLARYPGVPETHRLLERALVFERLWLEAEGLGAQLKPDKLEALAIEAQKVMERLFAILGADAPSLEGVLHRRVEEVNSAYYEGWAQAVGLRAPLPPALAHVRSGKVFAAQAYGYQTLQPQMLLALWAAYQAAGHPLRAMAADAPDLYARLSALARARDPAAHDAGVPLALSALEPHRQTVYLALDLYFRHSEGSAAVAAAPGRKEALHG
jgi:hypothetical protein